LVDIHSVLRPLEQFEKLMQEIYDKLAEVFSQDDEAAGLFSKLAFEEGSHLGQVQFLRRLVRQNGAHFGDVDIDPNGLVREVEELEKTLETVHRLSLPEALLVAIRFEGGVAELHGRSAIAKANPDVARTLGNLHAADERHRNALLDFANRRGFTTS
jgi:rubrerythrin